MRIMAAVLLLAGTLAGCVGPHQLGNFGRFSDEKLQKDYQNCLFHHRQGGTSICQDNLDHALAYRWSYRRFWPDISGGSGVDGPVPVIILN